ncbi:MAG: outer membrane beta-barrel protein [Bdellovibrionia bacterium]
MKMSVYILIGLMVSAQVSWAQDDSALRNELNQEIDLLLPKVKLRKKTKRDRRAEGVVLVNTAASDSAAGSNSSSGGNTNLNNSESAATAGNSTNVNVQVTEAPPSTVEASPLNESRLDRLKRKRLEQERANEEKLVERIENDRIEREHKRAAKTETLTFEDKALKEAEQSIEVNQVQTKETTIVAPVQIAEPQPIRSSETVSVKPVASIEEDFSKIEKKQPDEPTRWYVGGNAGLADYSAQNVKGIYAAGLTFGVVLPERIIVEAGILFSSFDIVAQPTGYYGDVWARTIQMDQRNYTLGAKYQFTRTRIRPTAGVLVSYTTREFEDPIIKRPSSQGYDAGLSVGADIALNEQFAIGADLRYFMNLSSRRDNSSTVPSGYGYQYGYGSYPGVDGGKFVDEINYFVLGINASIRF